MNNNIDDIFSNKLEDDIKKRIKNYRKTLNKKLLMKSTLITLITLSVICLILSSISNSYIAFFSAKEYQKEQLIYRIKNPNEYIGSDNYIGTGYFKYRNTYNICKKISGKVIFAGAITSDGGIFNNPICGEKSGGKTIPINTNILQRSSTSSGLREMYFAYPDVNYDIEINDFYVLDEISNEKVLEMAISFDKEYTYEEVNNMIAKNLITFYWVDNRSIENKENNKNSQFKEMNHEDRVIGIKSNNLYGEFMYDTNDRKIDFIDAVKKLNSTNADEKSLVKNIDENNIKIIGVVVIGTPDELMPIQNTNFVKHAVLGSVVDKY